MKKLIMILALALLLIPTICIAVEKTVICEFAYNGSDHSGFRLYLNNQVVMDETLLTSDVRTGTKRIDIPEGKNEFYITAIMSDGQESQPSASYFFEFLDVNTPSNKIELRITIQ